VPGARTAAAGRYFQEVFTLQRGERDVFPTQAMLNRLATILGADTGSIAAAAAPKVHLAQAVFTPGPGLTLGGLTEATFVGYAALSGAPGAVIPFTDPLTGLQTINLPDPAGGWHFGVTGGAGLPQTMYGWYVTDSGQTTLWGAQLFITPVVLTATGQGVDIPLVRFALSQAALQ
jgi:hypothetical protein